VQTTFRDLPRKLKKDDVFVFPTDTVMGVGCRMDSPIAINRLYKIKKRPDDQPTAVLVADSQMATLLMKETPDHYLLQVMRSYWPGELTIIVKASHIVPSTITGKTGFVGIRIPDHTLLRKFISDIDVPIVATSANFKGGPTPCLFADIDSTFLTQVDWFIGENSLSDKASTVIKYLGGGHFEYVRHGSIEIKQQ